MLDTMKATIKGNKLAIEIDLRADPKPSSSGKNLLLASETQSPEGCEYKGKQVKIGVNAYVPNN